MNRVALKWTAVTQVSAVASTCAGCLLIINYMIRSVAHYPLHTVLLSSFIHHNLDLWSPAEIECMTAGFIQLTCLLLNTLSPLISFPSHTGMKGYWWKAYCFCVCVGGWGGDTALITILTDQHDEEWILLKYTKVNTGN